MQKSNQTKPIKVLEDKFESSKCQIQRKESILKIFHTMSFKELIRNHFQAKQMDPFDLGPESDNRTPNGQLPNNDGRFGSDWGIIRIKEGLSLEYSVKVKSVEQELEVSENKSVENVDMQVGGRMNLIASVDENEPLILDNMSSKSDKKPEEPKLVFTLNVDVNTRLRLDDSIDR